AGKRRRNPLALYSEDESHDLSDLGIGTSSTKSSLSEDCDTHSLASDGMDLDKNHSDVDNMSNCDMNRKLGSSANEYDTCTTTTISSPEPEEYTYEGAIEGYKSRIISQTNSSMAKTLVNNNKEKSPEKSDVNRIRTSVSNKIEEKVSSFQQERANDTKNNNMKKDLPKVNIHKRREQFERENSQELQTKPKLPEIANKKSIKDRLSSLERFTEEIHLQKSTSDLTKLPTEVKPLKERLSSLEKVKTASAEPEKVKRLSNGDINNSKSLKERLSSLKSQTSEEEVKANKTELKEVSMSLKERLSCLDAAKNKEIPKISVEEEIARCEKFETNINDENDKINESSLKSSLLGIENQMQSFCRSLDSLDINGQSSPSSMERVQSLEDFDCDMQNNTVPSDIETEDSGIHTARDSAPADDIADLTQVSSPIGEPMVSEYESSNEDGIMMEHKIEESIELAKTPEPSIQTVVQDIIVEEEEEQYSKADDDSASHYAQALSQPEEISNIDELTEIQMDKEDDDTLKSLDNQDTSVSLNEPVSTASEGDTVVFEGKMTIHLNLNEICNKLNAGAGKTNVSTNTKSMPMVTVSNITTITNISPKNSIKSLKTFENNTLNNVADLTCTSECSLVKLVDNSPHVITCDTKNNEVAQNRNNTVPENDLVSTTQDSNPFWQKRTKRSIEPNRRKTILCINNKVLDALELAFQELDSEDNITNTNTMDEFVKTEKKQTKDLIDDDPEFNKKICVTPLYENIDLFYQNTVDAADAFPLDMPMNVLEPPKEKPPPPPTDDNVEDELLGNGNFKHTSSARRIKKEIRNKRSSFLGIEGQVDDSYLDVDLNLAPRPDITSFLQEETKIEKLLYKKTLSHDMDAKLRESRDSGVDVDRGPSAEAWYRGQSSPEVSNPHSRQNSEITLTSDEEESKKEFSSHLTSKLIDLEGDQMETLDMKLQQQQEVLRFERELLQLEQEELRRQRENLLRDQTRIIQKSVQDVSAAIPEKPPLNRPKNNNYRHSMPNLALSENYVIPKVPELPAYDENMKRKPFVSEEHIQRHFGVEESRRVLYEDRKER
ncbi:Uncharacterized protein OBRU01_15333, partial [Operophtera brumata]